MAKLGFLTGFMESRLPQRQRMTLTSLSFKVQNFRSEKRALDGSDLHLKGGFIEKGLIIASFLTASRRVQGLSAYH